MLEESALGAGCDDNVGAFYDPTHQCPPWSGSEYCTDGMLCEDVDYMYDCDFENDRYSCAPGDLSGKFGSITNAGTENFLISQTDPGTLSPLIADLNGKVMAIYCAKADQADLAVFACTHINTYTTTEPESSSTCEPEFTCNARGRCVFVGSSFEKCVCDEGYITLDYDAKYFNEWCNYKQKPQTTVFCLHFFFSL